MTVKGSRLEVLDKGQIVLEHTDGRVETRCDSIKASRWVSVNCRLSVQCVDDCSCPGSKHPRR